MGSPPAATRTLLLAAAVLAACGGAADATAAGESTTTLTATVASLLHPMTYVEYAWGWVGPWTPGIVHGVVESVLGLGDGAVLPRPDIATPVVGDACACDGPHAGAAGVRGEMEIAAAQNCSCLFRVGPGKGGVAGSEPVRLRSANCLMCLGDRCSCRVDALAMRGEACRRDGGGRSLRTGPNPTAHMGATASEDEGLVRYCRFTSYVTGGGDEGVVEVPVAPRGVDITHEKGVHCVCDDDARSGTESCVCLVAQVAEPDGWVMWAVWLALHTLQWQVQALLGLPLPLMLIASIQGGLVILLAPALYLLRGLVNTVRRREGQSVYRWACGMAVRVPVACCLLPVLLGVAAMLMVLLLWSMVLAATYYLF